MTERDSRESLRDVDVGPERVRSSCSLGTGTDAMPGHENERTGEQGNVNLCVAAEENRLARGGAHVDSCFTGRPWRSDLPRVRLAERLAPMETSGGLKFHVAVAALRMGRTMVRMGHRATAVEATGAAAMDGA